MKPAQLRKEAEVLEVCYQVNERRACNVIQLLRSTYQYRNAAY